MNPNKMDTFQGKIIDKNRLSSIESQPKKVVLDVVVLVVFFVVVIIVGHKNLIISDIL